MQRVYLDANATTPLDPRVLEAMTPWLDCGNASSPHADGRAARTAIDAAREQVASLIGARPREVVFTSGATEANALALLGSIRATNAKRAFCSAVEHPSVLRTLERMRPDLELQVGAVDAHARMDPEVDFGERPGLVSVMLANNETGALQAVARIAERGRAAGAVMHTDAVQACGKVPVDVGELGVDLLSLSAHKMNGPKGAGALYVRRSTPMAPLFHGGEHERGLRPGTENVAAIVGLGAAAELAAAGLDERRARWEKLGGEFLAGLRETLPEARLNSPPEPRERIANTFSITIPGVEADALLLALDLEGVSIATGSACSSGAVEPSHVLLACGLSQDGARQSIRISMHDRTTARDLAFCLNKLSTAVKRLRGLRAC